MKYTKPKAELVNFEVTSVILDSIGGDDWGGVWSLRRPTYDDYSDYGDSDSNGTWE